MRIAKRNEEFGTDVITIDLRGITLSKYDRYMTRHDPGFKISEDEAVKLLKEWRQEADGMEIEQDKIEEYQQQIDAAILSIQLEGRRESMDRVQEDLLGF